jgi:hypothetical protein
VTFALVEHALRAVAWAEFQVILGRPAADIPDRVRALLSATTEDEADKSYWTLDNHCVVQGQLFDSSVPLVSVLLAALASPIQAVARRRVADLLVEIVNGESDASEVARGNTELGLQARQSAASGLWLAYRLTADDDPETRWHSLYLVDALDRDRERVRALLEVAVSDPDAAVSEAARSLLAPTQA